MKTFKLTGISVPVLWYASIALSHPRTGPLSSEEPLPYNFPFLSVKTNGSLSHPSEMSAGCTSKCP